MSTGVPRHRGTGVPPVGINHGQDAHATLVIAGTASGVGKTSLTLGLTAALRRRGLAVRTFKVGPDFLDPTHLAMASGRTCYNLDGWMTGRDYVCDLFESRSAGADVAIIEGVMGLFDGASATTLEGSTAEIAAWLDAPVVLVVNAHGAARSLAATVRGFAQFEPAVRVAGVIANQAGSGRHRQGIAESLAAAGGPPLLGAVPRGALPTLESRHLGLIAADSGGLTPEALSELAKAVEAHVNVEKVLEIARKTSGRPAATRYDELSPPATRYDELSPPATRYDELSPAATRYDELSPAATRKTPLSPPGVAKEPVNAPKARIGVARDAAFHFYYADTLETLAYSGAAEVIDFSPLHDAALPDRLDAIYLGGGYPEAYAEQLAANKPMLDAIRRFAASGRVVYAECGGLIYLGRSLERLDGRRFALAGVLPIETAMRDRLQSLGYVEATLRGDSPLGGAGQTLRGHEFHYSQIVRDDASGDGWRPAYSLVSRRGRTRAEGFQRGNIFASYVHAHLASLPGAAARLVELCRGTRGIK